MMGGKTLLQTLSQSLGMKELQSSVLLAFLTGYILPFCTLVGLLKVYARAGSQGGGI
jgi:hypothetical protein